MTRYTADASFRDEVDQAAHDIAAEAREHARTLQEALPIDTAPLGLVVQSDDQAAIHVVDRWITAGGAHFIEVLSDHTAQAGARDRTGRDRPSWRSVQVSAAGAADAALRFIHFARTTEDRIYYRVPVAPYQEPSR